MRKNGWAKFLNEERGIFSFLFGKIDLFASFVNVLNKLILFKSIFQKNMYTKNIKIFFVTNFAYFSVCINANECKKVVFKNQ